MKFRISYIDFLVSWCKHSICLTNIHVESCSQGLKFRRNFAEIRRKISFSLLTGKKNSVFFGKFRLKIQNSKKFGQNSPKFTEISERNFVSAKHRDLQRKRNG